MSVIKRPLIAIALVGLVLAAAPAYAQVTSVNTGSLVGTATDPDGAPLPGVTVTLESVAIPTMTTVTRGNGVYRFLSLPPGEYAVSFELQGFKTVIVEGNRVTIGNVLTVGIGMELSSVEETITVTSTAPIVDVKKTGFVSNKTEQYLQGIPSARDPWVMLQHTAGVQVDRVNVGGSESGQQSNFSSGARRGDTTYSYDGAEITDMAASGASPMYYDFDAFEEVSIGTGGNDVSKQTGGVQLNFVTKRGGNEWRANGRFYLTDGSMQSSTVDSYSSDQLYPGYIGNSINNIKDFGGDVGGPVIKDSLFVWGAYGKQDIKQNVGVTPDDTLLISYHGKLTAHLSDSDVFNGAFIRTDKQKFGRGASATRPAPTTWNQTGPTTIYTGKFQHTFSDDLYMEATGTYVDGGFQLDPIGGRDVPANVDWFTGAWWGTYVFYGTTRPKTTINVDGNAYIADALGGDHELKFGYYFRDAEVSSDSNWGNGLVQAYWNGSPSSVWLVGGSADHYKGNGNSFYLGDTMSAGRLTVNAGLRLDMQTSQILASSTPANPFFPEAMPAHVQPDWDPGWSWNTISPRVGFTYDLTGDGSTILRANASRYYAMMQSWEFDFGNNTAYAEFDYQWFDDDGDGVLSAGDSLGDLYWGSAGFDPDNPSVNVGTGEKTSSPYTDEFIFGLEHELVRNLAIGVQAQYRKNGNETWSPRLGLNLDPWVPFTTVGGNNVVYQPTDLISPISHYQQRAGYNTQYKGLEFFVNKRFSDRWMANGSLMLINYIQNYPDSAGYTNPTNIDNLDGEAIAQTSGGSGRSGTYYGSATWYFKGSAMYQLPAGINLATFAEVRQGYMNPPVNRVRIANGISWFNAFEEVIGDTKLDTFYNVDFRLEKTLDIGEAGRVHLIADVFNLLNNDVVLARHNQSNSSRFQLIREVMNARTLRLGARLVLN